MTGLIFEDKVLSWSGLKIPCIVDEKNEHISYGLQHRVKYCRLVRRKINSKNRFYIQLILEGIPYQNPDHKIGNEEIGLDVGPNNCVGGCTYGSAVCVQNALIRVLRFVEPNESFSTCYYKNDLGEEVCYYYPKSYCLPCYPVTVLSVPNSFYHSIACLQIGTDVNNFNNWLFFQYNASDIVPGSWDMPLPCSVVVDNLVNGICAGYGTGVSIAKWNIDKNGVIT